MPTMADPAPDGSVTAGTRQSTGGIRRADSQLVIQPFENGLLSCDWDELTLPESMIRTRDNF